MSKFAYYQAPDGRTVYFCTGPVCIGDWSGIYEPASSHITQSVPGQDGSKYVGSYLQPREVTITVGYVSSYSVDDIQSWRRQAQSVCNSKLTNTVKNAGLLVVSEGSVERKFHAVPDGIEMGSISKYKGANDAIFTFQCFDPYAYELNSQITPASSVVKTFTFPATFGPAITYSTSQVGGFTVNSPGDVESPVEIVVYGPCINPVIENSTTGETMSFTLEMESGDILVIDTRKYTVYLNDVNAIESLNVDSVFWKIIPGENLIVFSEDTPVTIANCTLEWSDCYVGF